MINSQINLKSLIKISIIVISVLFSSCEDVITYDLENASPQIVIEGSITDESDLCTVKISKSTNYFNPGISKKVSNAIVTIGDNEGNMENLVEQEPGVYQTTNFKTTYNKEYTIEVRSDNKIYSASTSLVTPLIIDSLSYELETGVDENYYEIFAHFQDDPEKNDYAVVNARLNNVTLEDLIIYEDRLTNGNYIKSILLQLEKDDLKTGSNTIEFIIRIIDVDTYDYYRSLIDVLAINTEVSPFSPTAPENPKSNFSNDALGYFGGYSISRKSIEIIKL